MKTVIILLAIPISLVIEGIKGLKPNKPKYRKCITCGTRLPRGAIERYTTGICVRCGWATEE